jgi:hypothetical protein
MRCISIVRSLYFRIIIIIIVFLFILPHQHYCRISTTSLHSCIQICCMFTISVFQFMGLLTESWWSLICLPNRRAQHSSQIICKTNNVIILAYLSSEKTGRLVTWPYSLYLPKSGQVTGFGETYCWTRNGRNREAGFINCSMLICWTFVYTVVLLNWIGHILRRNCLLQRVFEGNIKGGIEVTGRQGRRRRKLLDDLKERRGYSYLKEEALDRTMWRDRFGRGFVAVVRQTTKWMND